MSIFWIVVRLLVAYIILGSFIRLQMNPTVGGFRGFAWTIASVFLVAALATFIQLVLQPLTG